MTSLGMAERHADGVGQETQVQLGMAAGNRLPKGLLAISQAGNERRISL